MDLLELELGDRAYLHERDWPSELSGVGATERQLAILDRFHSRWLKRYANNVRCDSSLVEEVVRDCRDGGIYVRNQGTNRQVSRSDPRD